MRGTAILIAGLLLLIEARSGAAQSMSSHESGSPHGRLGMRVTALASYAIPCGEFGRTKSYQAGFARTGPGGGVELSDLYTDALEVGVAVWMAQNQGDGDAFARKIEALFESLGLSVPAGGYHVSMTKWTSVWALMKIGYSPKVSAKMRAFGACYLGGVYARGPKMAVVVAPPGISSTSPPHAYTGVAGGFGVGMRWGEHVTFESLGLLSSMSPHGWTPNIQGYEQPMAQLHVALGYGFGFGGSKRVRLDRDHATPRSHVR